MCLYVCVCVYVCVSVCMLVCVCVSVCVYVCVYVCRGGSRIDLKGGLIIPRALVRAKFYVLRPLLTSFPH